LYTVDEDAGGVALTVMTNYTDAGISGAVVFYTDGNGTASGKLVVGKCNHSILCRNYVLSVYNSIKVWQESTASLRAIHTTT